MSSNWYVIFFLDDAENEYFQASSDEEAIKNVQNDLENIAEVYRCNDNETLSPQKRIYPIIGKIEEANNQ